MQLSIFQKFELTNDETITQFI